jgi:transcriptional regulator with XRE-family HTH domain
VGRPQRPIPDEDRSPAAEFARQLRQLRAAAGNPTYAQLQRRTGYSDTTLSAAMSGRGRPSREVVETLVTALGGDPVEWDEKWRSLPGPDTAPTTATAGPPGPEFTALPEVPARARGRKVIVAAAIGLVAVAVAVLGHQLANDSEAGADPDPPVTTSITVTVQNQVTAGPAAMREDSPAYLSTRPENNCRSRGCAAPGDTLDTGDRLEVVCQLTGERTTNGNDGDPSDDRNPELFTSTRWYGSPLPDGGTGYLAETWLSPADRGGLDLPRCE